MSALTIVKEEPTPLSVVGETPALKIVKQEKTDNKARENLPDTLRFAGMDTGVPINPELSAYLVNMGAGITGSYRGAKQLLGLDKPERKLSDLVTGTDPASMEADNEAALRRLSEDPQVGGYATAGRFAGMGLDPVTYLLPVTKAKSVVDLVKYGAMSGAVAGALNPVEEGGSRTVNTAIGMGAGAVFAPVVGTVANRLSGGPRMPLRTPAQPAAPGPTPIVAAPTASPASPASPARPQDIVDEYTSMVLRGEASIPKAAPKAVQEAAAPLAKEAGGVDVNLATRMAGGAVGGATGALTADENASPQEIAARTLLGAAGGWQLAKVGAKVLTVRPGTSHPGLAKAAEEAAAKGAEPVNVIGDLAEPLFKQEVSPATTKGISAVAKEFFEANPGLRDPSRRVSDDIMRYVAGDAVPPEILAKHGITGADFAKVWRDSISDHAKSLGYLSQVAQKFQANMTPEEQAAFKAAGGVLEDAAYVRPFWKKITDTWRALLVTQPATAVRNAITQAGRVGLDVIQSPIDSFVQKLTGRPQTVHAMDGLEEAWSVLGRANKADVEKILQAFPKEKDRMFQTYLSDVASATGIENKAWQAIDKGVQMANVLNRGQEFIIRRGIFQSALDHELRNKGKDLVGIIKSNAIGQIDDESVKKAVSAALNKTFAETPDYGTMSRKLIDAVNSVPGANLAIPFPRFMYNAIKFQYEYSPLGILSYLSEAERAAFAAGNVGKASKAVIGSAMFGAAMMFRNSENAGEKWYEAVNDKGEVIDLRPFNPFASYLFVADVLKRQNEGTLYKLTGGDIAQGLLSTNMRAGTGLYLLDSAINLISKSADEAKLSMKATEFAGDFLSGFFTPLNVFRDAYDQITQGQSTVKNTRDEPLLGPIKNRIPGVSQSLPDAEFPTREGPKVYEDPLLRQATGLSTQGPKNAAEKELDRLGFDRREILTSTGDREIDTQYTKAMGAVSEKVLVPLVESQKFQEQTDAVKGAILHEVLSEVRQEVKEAVNEGLPEEKQLKLEIKKQPPRIRYLLEELGVKVK